MPELQLGIYASYALKKEVILRILKVANEEKGVNDTQDNLVRRTGLGSRKASTYRAWSIRSGLVDKQTGKLSPQGEIVYKCDPYLYSSITDWLMHFYLSFGANGLAKPPENPSDWGGWTWFVYSFLPNRHTFKSNTFENAAYQVYESEGNKAENISEKLSKILKAYTDKKDALSQINFLKSPAKDQYIAGEATLPPDELIAYFLAMICERDFQGLSQINSDRLLHHPYGLAPLLGISPDQVQDLLDRLSGKGIIEQYKTVPPFQIIPRWNEPLELLEKAYVNN